MRHAHLVTAALLAVTPLAAARAADNPRQLFAKDWEGRTVVVTRTLYTLVYNERGRLGATRRNRRDGLTVVTPFLGTYLQFDGRQSQDDITDQDPQQLVDTVTETYRSDALEVRTYQKIEPIVVARYEVGTELVVREIRIERDTLRLLFSDPGSLDNGSEPATGLTIKWPTPLSRSLTERQAVETLIGQFVKVKGST